MGGAPLRNLNPGFTFQSDSGFTHAISAGDYDALTRENPAPLCFNTERELLYRTCSAQSYGSNIPGKDIRAGMLVEQPFTTRDEWISSIYMHMNRCTQASPFISVTPDLIRAITIALQNQHYGGVGIFVVDPTKLPHGSIISLRTALKNLTGQSKSIHETEYLVWQKIPAEAVICFWTWEVLRRSDLFDHFPGLKGDGTSTTSVGTVRTIMRQKAKSPPSISEIVSLTGQLKLDPDSFATKQVVTTMFAWCKEKFTVRQIREFENSHFPKTEEREIDNAIYGSRTNGSFLDFKDWWLKCLTQAHPQTVSEGHNVKEIISGFAVGISNAVF
ncbi:hypothetical protein K469DRAFT_695518 [Zopfia rhizophila CBS 207.26]|uniref:DUF7587 domain-containing protein n=1 Tax=Zopfia rhizophila CBS 207.26 TaxID=1314779 RepID=A0A6A6DIE8_9PEZI|nr:hypothetical protein K469DRAFT_695518 [Zopfia rhizophila CBS 207.26]